MMADIHWMRPWWLLALPPALWLVWRFYRAHGATSAWREVCDPLLLPHLLSDAGSKPARGAYLGLAVAMAIAVVALAGPAWQRAAQNVEQTLDARVVVLDLSRSMNAPDLKPSRLARARLKVADVLNRSREGQIGLIAFAGDAFVVSPLTRDANTVKAMLPALDSAIMPVQGSRVDRGVALAAKLLRRAGTPDGEVLLITDGMSDVAAARAAVRALRSQGAHLSVLAVGTREGAPIARTTGGFVKDDAGNIVIPRLDASSLEHLAIAGGGGFALITPDDSDLNRVLTQRRRPAHTRRAARQARLWQEQGPWLVALLLPLAALAFRRGWLLVLVLAVGLPLRPASALGWQDLWRRPDQRAARALNSGDAERAARIATDPRWRGSALYRSEHYAEAVRAFAHASPEDPVTDYNRGNALARQGKLEQALAAYNKALARDPKFADAIHNRDLVQRLVQQRKAPGPSQQKPQKNATKHHDGNRKNRPRQAQAGAKSASQAAKQETPADASSDSKAKRGEHRKSARTQRPKTARGNQRDAAETISAPTTAQRDRASGRPAKPTAAPTARESTHELARAAERQWLRRIPDDPGGLLRRKFALELRRRGGRVQTDGQAW